MLGVAITITSLVLGGIFVLMINQALFANVPDDSDIAKMILESETKLKWCGDNIDCKNAVQLELNAVNLYQQENRAKETGQILGSALIILPSALGVIAVASRN